MCKVGQHDCKPESRDEKRSGENGSAVISMNNSQIKTKLINVGTSFSKDSRKM